ncbi:MAG: YIP1 family protein [Pyrinomonadaceae bacterium]
MSDPNIGNFQTPPPPRFPEDELPAGPTMSTGETLGNVFFEPGSVFESLRSRPRFIVAGLIVIALSMAFTVLFFQRIGYDRAMREALENSPRSSQMSPEQKAKAFELYQKPYVKAFTYATPIIGIAIAFAVGAALYLLGVMAMGKRISYAQALSVWVYSSLPPAVLTGLLSVVLLFLKSPDDIDPSQLRGGIVHADLSVLVDAKASPALAAALGSIDLFTFYGLFLAALGLRYVARLSSGAAWGIVLTIWIVKVALRIIWAIAFGTAIG